MKNKFSLHLFTSICLTLTSDRFTFAMKSLLKLIVAIIV